MADLLGSILGSMEKPPVVGGEERKRAREQKKQFEKIQQQEKDRLAKFKLQIQKRINDFTKDAALQKFKFEPMDKVYRTIVHEVTEVAGLASFSFGQEEEDRYVMLWKKEFAPTDEELTAYRRGEEWDPAKAKQLAKQREIEDIEAAKEAHNTKPRSPPNTDYHEKYERLIGKSSAKDAARATTANVSYGFVPSENKRDVRTIEQVMADNRAKKKLKTEHSNGSSTPEVSTSTESKSRTDNSSDNGQT